MKKLDMKSKDLQQENIKKLEKLFPEVITEIKDENGNIKKGVDFDILKQLLSDVLVEGPKERYGLNWVGKKEALLNANLPITKTLRPKKKESIDFENTKNIYIEGDNLEVLKIIQESYLGKIKMIYIDPPYNTGKDFIYKDNFKKSREEYNEEIRAVDEEGNKLFKNTDSNGRFHSDWLSMMYSRLKISRDLLIDDGVIFISIDDNEVHNLRHICDEIFGDGNFLYQLTVVNNLNGNDNSSGMMETHEYCLIYAKNKDKFEFGVLPIDDEKELEKWHMDEKGYYKEGGGLKATGEAAERQFRPNLFFPIYINENNLDFSLEKKDGYYYELLPITNGKEMRWYWSKEKFMKDKNEIIIKKTKDGYSLYKKQRPSLGDLPSKRGKTTFYSPNYSMANSNAYIKKIFNGKKIFDYPKPLELIIDFIRLANTKDNEIILDFFSGSATCAEAVMELNAEDGGNRQFIMVQLPEKTDEKSEAYKAGYRTIAEIGRERIRRAGKKIKKEYLEKYEKELEKLKKDKNQLLENEEIDEKIKELEKKIEHIKNLDIGFISFYVDTSNMKDVYYHPEKIDQKNIDLFESNIKEDRTSYDLLFQVMLDLGLELSLKIEEKNIKDNKVFFIEYNSLVCCFDDNINFEIIDEIAKIKPLKVVFKDSSFKEDKDRINMEERFKLLSSETEIMVI